MPFSVASIDAALSGWHHCRRWVVGFSGGMDSTVLLTSVHGYLQRHAFDSPPALVALHINHHLHPDADAWQDHCRQFCRDRGIAFESVSVTVPQRGDGPEAAARQARYNAFTDFLRTEDLLLLAQHRDDQAETVLLNLMRGSGSRGLRGIPVCRQVGAATLLRPLLDFSRSELVEWANAAALDWIEDDSNRDTALSRNFLRQRVLPVLREHWPAAETAIASSAGWLHQEQTLLEEVASEDLARCARRDGEGLALRIDKMLELSAPRRANLLRYWLLQFGVRARRTQLQEIGDAVILAAADGRPLVRIGGHSVRRHGGAVYCVRDYPDPVAFLWTPEAQPEIPGWGRLVAQHGDVGGLRPARHYQVRFRVGGERAHPVDRDRSTTLKKLFQEYAIPQWQRDRWPILYRGEAMAAVPGLFVCRGFAVQGDEPGWYLRRDPIHCAPF